MANLSQAQIEMYAQSAGMANPQVMAAIAMAESGGNPNAHNVIPPDDSYGLWQINMIGSMGPTRRKEYGITSNDALFNPAVNAKAAAKILSGQGPSAWSTYTSGAYKKYLKGGSGGTTNATDVINWNDPLGIWGSGGAIGGEGLVPGLADSGGLGPITDVAKLGVQAGQWMSNPHNWLNVLYVVVGGVIVVAALSATVRGKIMDQVKTVAPIAEAA